MSVRMEGLRRLHQSMRGQGIDRYRFDYSYGKAQFDVIFLADERPYILLLGLRGGSMAFEFEVDDDYVVHNVFMDPAEYQALVRLLGVQYDPANRFRPAHFLEWVDRAAPTSAHVANRPTSIDVARFRRDVEEQDKVYFLSWRHYPRDGRGP